MSPYSRPARQQLRIQIGVAAVTAGGAMGAGGRLARPVTYWTSSSVCLQHTLRWSACGGTGQCPVESSAVGHICPKEAVQNQSRSKTSGTPSRWYSATVERLGARGPTKFGYPSAKRPRRADRPGIAQGTTVSIIGSKHGHPVKQVLELYYRKLRQRRRRCLARRPRSK